MKTLKMNSEGSKESHVFTTVLRQAMQNIEKLAQKKSKKQASTKAIKKKKHSN